MRTEIITKTYLKFSELNDDQKNKVIENFDNNGWLYDHCMDERIDTLRAFGDYIDADIDFSLSYVSSRGEYIRVSRSEESAYLLTKLIYLNEDCPLTGCYYDDILISALKAHDGNLEYAFHDYITSIHDEYYNMVTVDYIGDMCEANEYEFDSETLEMV